MMVKFCAKCGAETDRYVSGDCKTCARVRCANRRAANPDRDRAEKAKWHAENRERIKARKAKCRADNHEKVLAKEDKYRADNPEKIKASNAKFYSKNPETFRISGQNYRARKRENGGKLSKWIVERLFKLQRCKCACCKQLLGDTFHRDHIMPLALGGTNTDDNMQLLCQPCNNQKHAKHPVCFMQQKGFLL